MKKFLLLLPLLLVGCDDPKRIQLEKLEDSKYLQPLEHGVINGYSYSILLHKPTGKKIFTYSYNGMIYLPETDAEKEH